MSLDASRPPPGSPRPSEVSQPREVERGGPGGRRAVIGLLGARPSARRVGTGRGQLLLGSGVRAPIDPAAAQPRCLLLRVAGGAGAPSGAGEPALPFAAAAAISAFSGREGGRGLVAAAGAGFSPRTVLLFSSSSSARRRRPPPAPSCAARVREGRERGGGGREKRTRAGRKLLPDPCVPAPSVHPRPASAAAAAGKGSGGGGATGAGPAVPALSCGAWLLPARFPSPPLLGPGSAPPAQELLSSHLLGKEDTPALVEKTFPADWVGAAVAGSPGSDLSSACLSCPAGCRL